jgi:hypothetical protein
LQYLFPSDRIKALPLKSNILSESLDHISNADVVVALPQLRNLLSRQNLPLPRQFIDIPGFYFSAFHPDIVAAKTKSNGTRFPTSYNSAIVLWGYLNGITPADVQRLFTKQVFAQLGYFDRWESSVARMQTAFEKCGLDFDRIYLPVKREGIFMHTVNHPKVSVLATMAKQIAERIEPGATFQNRDIPINDGLLNVEMWPVYPAVAHELAVPGAYTWRVERGTLIDGLANYIEYAYEKYTRSGIPASEFQITGIDRTHHDSVLSAHLGSRP